jgi:alkanesulfonate monooxygenase SsuD/methylene tetrahydromethanopterin reductase-like flavin-dependent oxidoreductase (luciferase family)
LRFGFAVPIFANPGVPDFRTPNFEELDWEAVRAGVLEAERLGYDSAWVADHMFLGRDGAILEGWTTISALAGLTSTMHLGTIHLGNEFRHPPLVAKMAATLDVISRGRLEFFVDPGWREREHVAYGFGWEPDRAIRARRLSEALDLMKRLWTEDVVSHDGPNYVLDGATCAPKPAQARGPRVWIGEAFDEATLDLIVRHADVWNSMPAGAAILEGKIAKVDEACRARGRDPSTLIKTLETQVLVFEERSEVDGLFDRFAELRKRYPSGEAMRDVVEFVSSTNPNLGNDLGPDDAVEEFLIGTSEELVEKLGRLERLGIEEVICWFMDFPERTSMIRFAEEVIPRVQTRVA